MPVVKHGSRAGAWWSVTSCRMVLACALWKIWVLKNTLQSVLTLVTGPPGGALHLHALMHAEVLISLTLYVLLMARALRPCCRWLHHGNANLPLAAASKAVLLSPP